MRPACAQVPLPEEEAAKLASRPEKLAIGGEGGFQLEADRFTLQKEHSLAVLPEMLSVPLPCPELPALVLSAIQGVQVRVLSHSMSFPGPFPHIRCLAECRHAFARTAVRAHQESCVHNGACMLGGAPMLLLDMCTQWLCCMQDHARSVPASRTLPIFSCSRRCCVVALGRILESEAVWQQGVLWQ